MIPSALEEDAKSIARGNWRAVISRSMKIPERQSYIVKCVGKVLHFELCTLCSDEYFDFLSGKDVNQFISFKWTNVMDEIKRHMPVLYQLLRKCMETPSERENTDKLIGVIISILAKHRRPQSSLFQKIVSLLLYSGHCSKKVFYIILYV